MSKRKERTMFLAAVVLLAAAMAALVFVYRNRSLEQTYAETEEIFGNPLMGFAPCAWYDEVGEDVSLLYVDVTWRELEPEKGVYNWEAIEEENQFDRWKKEGKHLILRFVCDIPGDEKHMDIPDWLYEETEGDWYDMEYGKGYGPYYGSSEMIRYHEKAVKAMGERWGEDTLISFIELGSLGHWGEWHVNYSQCIRRLPGEKIRQLYVTPWVEAFPKAKLMMRRPFAPAKEYGLGLFNDMAGDPDSTAFWLDWIRNGGDFSQTEEADALVPMEDFWKTAPSGGELTSGIPMKELTGSRLLETVELLRESHTTFLGPKVVPKEYQQGYQKILGSMGYRLWISKSALKQTKKGTLLTLTWENNGTAPFYGDWPVYIEAEETKSGSDTGSEGAYPMEICLTKILPGEALQQSVLLPGDVYSLVKEGRLNLTVKIIDPMTEKPALRLANSETDGTVMRLYSKK